METRIPDEREDLRLDRQHEDEKLKHIKDHEGDLRRNEQDSSYHQMKEAKEGHDYALGYEERDERHRQHARDASLVEEANTNLIEKTSSET